MAHKNQMNANIQKHATSGEINLTIFQNFEKFNLISNANKSKNYN